MTNQQTAEEMLKSLLTKTDNLNLKRTKNRDKHKYHQNKN